MLKENPQPDQHDFREQFKRSSRFQALIDYTHTFLAENLPIPRELFSQSFTGRLFEELAYLKYLESIGPRAELLDPHTTLEVFQLLYGDNKPLNTVLQESIANRYVPDGLLFRPDQVEGRVMRILEYTAQGEKSNLKSYIQKKEDGARLLRRHYPARFGDSKLVIVFTSDVHKFLAQQRVSDSRTFLTSVPYSHDSVHRYARDLLADNFGYAK